MQILITIMVFLLWRFFNFFYLKKLAFLKILQKGLLFIYCINYSGLEIGLSTSGIIISTKIEEVALEDIIQNTIELASLKAKDKKVTLNIINSNKELILADKVKLSNVIL